LCCGELLLGLSSTAVLFFQVKEDRIFVFSLYLPIFSSISYLWYLCVVVVAWKNVKCCLVSNVWLLQCEQWRNLLSCPSESIRNSLRFLLELSLKWQLQFWARSDLAQARRSRLSENLQKPHYSTTRALTYVKRAHLSERTSLAWARTSSLSETGAGSCSSSVFFSDVVVCLHDRVFYRKSMKYDTMYIVWD